MYLSKQQGHAVSVKSVNTIAAGLAPPYAGEKELLEGCKGGGGGWGPDFVWHKLKKNSFITSPLHSILCATNLKGKTSNLSSCE